MITLTNNGTAALTQDAHTETWEDMQDYVRQLAWRFIRKFPHVPYEEAEADAMVAFAEFCDMYDPSLGTKFITGLGHHIKYRLNYGEQKRWRRSHRLAYNSELVDPNFTAGDNRRSAIDDALLDADATATTFNSLTEWRRAKRSKDAAILIKLALETPGELIGLVDGKQLRIGLKRHLLKELGWTLRQIKETFEEVRECLMN